MYISTPPSPEVEYFQMKICYPTGDRTPELLNQRQTSYHLSHRSEHLNALDRNYHIYPNIRRPSNFDRLFKNFLNVHIRWHIEIYGHLICIMYMIKDEINK